jgi:hypothetical protein
LARSFNTWIADFTAGNRQEEALEQEIYALEVLANFKGAERASLIVHGLPENVSCTIGNTAPRAVKLHMEKGFFRHRSIVAAP